MPRSLSLSTGAAFFALIALICGLLLNSLLQLQALGTQLGIVVEHHNRKIDLITQIQVAAHIRTDSLFRMALTIDAFERDAYFMEFNRAGFLVGSGRKALRELGLSAAEQRGFDDQTRLVNGIQAVQERVIDLYNAERRTEAHQLLVMEVIPMQEDFNRQLADLRNAYQRANLAALSIGGFLPADDTHLLMVREMEATETLLLARDAGDQTKIAAAEKDLAAIQAERVTAAAKAGTAPAVPAR